MNNTTTQEPRRYDGYTTLTEEEQTTIADTRRRTESERQAEAARIESARREAREAEELRAAEDGEWLAGEPGYCEGEKS
jgi:hypothetical protein